MIIDLRSADTDPFARRNFDVCICGAGAAGITLATSLPAHLNIALLEAGGLEPTEESQDIYRGDNVGRVYFDLATTRLRYFGGTTNHWGGMCRPHDAVDFEAKSYAEYSGWPIEKPSLDPYIAAARTILDIPPDQPRSAVIQRELDRVGMESTDFENTPFWFSAPTRFGIKFRDEIESAGNISAYLNANVTDIQLNESGNAVSEFTVDDYAGQSHSIAARVFVLAAGGIENPRLLLNSASQNPAGVGNDNDLVGRFFTEHPHHELGAFILEDETRRLFLDNWAGKSATRSYYAPNPDFMRKAKILNGGLRVDFWVGSDQGNFRERVRSLICAADWSADLARRLRPRGKACLDGRLSGAFEQTPNYRSRVRLGQETDRFGNRRAQLDWQLLDIDRRTIRQLTLRFAEVFAELGLGRVKLEDWILDQSLPLPGFGPDEVAGHHHMCTTRMSASPQSGVVDAQQKVHGIDNLYIAGSSAFATGGHANPTFPIVQMSLRLADVLKTSLG